VSKLFALFEDVENGWQVFRRYADSSVRYRELNTEPGHSIADNYCAPLGKFNGVINQMLKDSLQFLAIGMENGKVLRSVSHQTNLNYPWAAHSDT
jgi:hypothetical protein